MKKTEITSSISNGEEQARSLCHAAAGVESRTITEQWDIFSLKFALLSTGVQKDLCSPCSDKV